MNKQILALARNSLYKHFSINKKVECDYSNELNEKGGVFVTLHHKGKLRGCIGLIDSDDPLKVTIPRMAISAAVDDPRFPPLSAQEVDQVTIEITLLSKLLRVKSLTDIIIGKHGLLIRYKTKQGLFLPQVAVENQWSRQQFLENLCANKIGVMKNCYLEPEAQIYYFTARIFKESS